MSIAPTWIAGFGAEPRGIAGFGAEPRGIAGFGAEPRGIVEFGAEPRGIAGQCVFGVVALTTAPRRSPSRGRHGDERRAPRLGRSDRRAAPRRPRDRAADGSRARAAPRARL